ncbi:NAD(P)-dependent oxidoreductase [Mycobacterium sp. AT1]|uniref:NAD(P)-dependent oxidoreductase n=1 Tax=Mycobacterium sp. AT1 TaxID=1961706 RepID=UPI0009AEE5E2|nr:NAD(P)-dependent oxidoreductase [Mycobacterium sp. AT1]OPX09596.1 oxidoreductase [Mycobacterium sp. AT1]
MIGIVGVGDMGLPMAGHMVTGGLDVLAHDVDPGRLAAAAAAGATIASGLAQMADEADVVVACLRTDDQMQSVAEELVAGDGTGPLGAGQLIVVAGTHSLEFMKRLAAIVEPRGRRIIDAPVVFGALGAREGNLLSLCGGEEADVERARPVMMTYSRGVEHVGPLGAGQIAKTCNNLLHWIHCVANFETLAIAKRYGLDAQRMREVLMKCPGDNGTLRRWDSTRFTWQEKDMDFAIELAQSAGLMLPLTGQVDQLVKTLTAADVSALLYGPECTYLGRPVAPLEPEDGGL